MYSRRAAAERTSVLVGVRGTSKTGPPEILDRILNSQLRRAAIVEAGSRSRAAATVVPGVARRASAVAGERWGGPAEV